MQIKARCRKPRPCFGGRWKAKRRRGDQSTRRRWTQSTTWVLFMRIKAKMQEAEAMYRRALEGYEKTWEPEHTSTRNTVSNLGLLYVDPV